MSILKAVSEHIVRDCHHNALTACLVNELDHFIDSLEMYEQVANFPIRDLFKFARFEEGLPKSIIL